MKLPTLSRRQFAGQSAFLLAALGLAPARLLAQQKTAVPAGPWSAVKVGFAERDITPKLGMEQPGGYGKSFHKTFHDPCKVRAVVFDDGRMKVALVGTDTLLNPRHLILAAREDIQRRCGIPGANVMIGASHSHSSGPTGMVQPGEFHHASDLVKKLAYEQSSCADPEFLELVQQQIADAVCAAHDSRVEARIAFGSGHEDKVAFNRRQRMKNGLTFSHAGKVNPDIVDYAGPIDPQVGVLGAYDQTGRLLGVLVNYACHGTTNPGGISANWIYYLEKTMRGALGGDFPVVFLQGACGDVTQVDNLNAYVAPAPERAAMRVGGRIGAEAVRALLLAEPGGDLALNAAQKVLKIPRRKPAPERLKEALELVQKDPKTVGATDWTFAKETVMLDAILAREPVADVEVQAIQVGPAVFAANPAEYFVQLGLDIKKGSKFPLTFPVELANGIVGYVPTEEAFGPHGGGYETRLTAYSNLEITAGTQIVKGCLELIGKFTPGQIPMPAKAPTGLPWQYGNLAPQVK
ncbi:MAG: hypothetical protein WCS99_07855 [Limisphaerales bacterium]